MSKEYTFLDLAKEVLEQVNTPLTPAAIWEKAVEKGLNLKLNSQGKTPAHTLYASLYVLAKRNEHSMIKCISRKPAIFGIRGRKYQDNDWSIMENLPDDTSEDARKDERDIHPLLTYFVRNNSHFRCYTKTIFHEDSVKQKKGLAKWVHPDMVGISFPFDEKELDSKTLALLKALQENVYKLFSFEIKRELNLSNYKKHFFQAVSNSSWAHEGYLVTLKLKDDEYLRQDLERLNHAFGIGVIVLDARHIEQSEILYLAHPKKIDIDTVDMLVSNNKDFEEFIDDVVADIEHGKRVRGKYDRELTDKEIVRHIEEHKLNEK